MEVQKQGYGAGTPVVIRCSATCDREQTSVQQHTANAIFSQIIPCSSKNTFAQVIFGHICKWNREEAHGFEG
ncbi:unnamed protein product [Rhodiola kirilowii]